MNNHESNPQSEIRNPKLEESEIPENVPAVRNPKSEIRNRKGGPKTAEGKKKVSMNALKHGGRAKAETIEAMLQEDPERDFLQILEDLVRHYQPKDPVEDQLVRRIALCTWRLYLSERMERRQRSILGARNTPAKTIKKISEYEKTVDINMHRAIRALNKKRYFESLAERPNK